MRPLKLVVTLWPSFPHFEEFASDDRISGIRLNSAMISSAELEQEVERLKKMKVTVPLYLDIKGRQLRVTEVFATASSFEVRLNHPIEVKTPTPVLFKAGAESALLGQVTEGGHRLIFDAPPRHGVVAGESLHIRDESLRVHGAQFTQVEREKIDRALQIGFRRFYLSYVESQQDVDEFRKLVGHDALVRLKIENKAGLNYVEQRFKKEPNVSLVAARGDLFVEVDMPHEILSATKLIVDADPDACVGSRILLSTISSPVPSCVDFSELAWLYDIGYREMMLCDELCLKGELLSRAVNVFESFRQTYVL